MNGANTVGDMADVGWLRELGAQGLVALLQRRPEAVAVVPPGSLNELSQRLADPGAVIAAMRRLDRPTLQVAEALAAVGGHADRQELAGLLGVSGVAAAAMDRALETLRDHGLLVDGVELALVDAARWAWPRPLELGAPAAALLDRHTADDLRAIARGLGLAPAARKAAILEQVLAALRDPGLVRSLVDGAKADVRELLHRTAVTGESVADFGYFSPRYGRASRPEHWAVVRGLLVRAADWDTGLTMPAEVALALRGPGYTAPFDPVAPELNRVPVDVATVARDSAAAGAAMLRLTGALLDEIGRAPLALLRSGGVGVRELRRLAKRCGASVGEVRLVLALTYEAGLFELSADEATPTPQYDVWLRGEPAERLAVLLRAWWALPYAPLAEAEAAWVPQGPAEETTALRIAVLTEAVEPAGGANAAGGADAAGRAEPVASAVSDPEALAALVLWRAPYAYPGSPQARAVACWREAALLGAVGAGAGSAAGRALLRGDDAELVAALATVGTAERSVRIQADLSAVVTGTPAVELAELLDASADRESLGAASTWRFTPASVRRALDAGHDPKALLADLSAVAVGGLPQPLEYLVGDVARRHGTVRGSEVACCLRSEDTALLAEIAADRRLRVLGLRALAPTVLAGAKPLAEVLSALRAAGYAPLAETADGTALLERTERRRSSAQRRPRGGPRPISTAPSRRAAKAVAPDLEGLVRALLAKPDTVALAGSDTLQQLRAATPQLADAQARLLAHAIDHGDPVTIDYVNANGGFSRRVIENAELIGTTLVAWCRLREDERMFNLGRIHAVNPVSTM